MTPEFTELRKLLAAEMRTAYTDYEHLREDLGRPYAMYTEIIPKMRLADERARSFCKAIELLDGMASSK